MNAELETMKAMAKKWRKCVNEELKGARNDRDEEEKKGNEEDFWYFKGYIRGLKFALKEGDIIMEEKEECEICHGKGYTTDHHDPCSNCGGKGYIE